MLLILRDTVFRIVHTCAVYYPVESRGEKARIVERFRCFNAKIDYY